MVPHNLSCANSKSDEIQKIPEILAKSRRIGHEFAQVGRIHALPQKPADKIFPRQRQLQGIRALQGDIDRKAASQGQQRPPATLQLRYQQVSVKYSQEEQAFHAVELFQARTRTRDGAATPLKWRMGSRCSSSPNSAGPLPEQSSTYKQPSPARTVVQWSFAATCRLLLIRSRREVCATPTVTVSAAISMGWEESKTKGVQIAGKGVSGRCTGRQRRSHHRQRQQTSGDGGVTRGRHRGQPQTVGQIKKRNAQNPHPERCKK